MIDELRGLVGQIGMIRKIREENITVPNPKDVFWTYATSWPLPLLIAAVPLLFLLQDASILNAGTRTGGGLYFIFFILKMIRAKINCDRGKTHHGTAAA